MDLKSLPVNINRLLFFKIGKYKNSNRYTKINQFNYYYIFNFKNHFNFIYIALIYVKIFMVWEIELFLLL
ncbi:MAG: hypothetical protein EDM69_10235 [Chlorobiota bacterium]|nr:MAG: hypothetical protein EDM69_10235 [Chlorobiota bacterium]MCE7953998.1 hypothetical protein [Chlorobi bacterium CHB7]OQY78794.1 MAG: hypothetical protein B6D43_01420 [Ignavibacteriales bacterium UTCHB1]RIK47529.1 MAG: hypothetical protein DCC60_10420 [Ignavibacteriota bacterium]